jgi:hypothetical protein
MVELKPRYKKTRLKYSVFFLCVEQDFSKKNTSLILFSLVRLDIQGLHASASLQIALREYSE